MEFKHIPIMLEPVLEGLDIKENGIYVDGTLGGAGHSSEIAARLGSEGRLIGIDQDRDAISAATKRLARYKNVVVVHNNYVNIRSVLEQLMICGVDGILLDLGVSSYQLDNGERGFSYREDAPLDMRMDRDAEYTAADIVNDYSEDELRRIISRYGEEKFAGRIASGIVKAREKQRIETTFQRQHFS